MNNLTDIKQKNKILKNFKAFTLVEMLISMLVISVLMVASVPMITQLSNQKTGTDKNVGTCIEADSSSWYNDSTGATSAVTTGTACSYAVTGAQKNGSKAAGSAIWIADHGTSAQKIMAKKILRAACDLGGEKACDYFINSCAVNGSGISPYCDDTSSFLDLTYYLHLNKDTYTNTNLGAKYIYTQLAILLPKWQTNLLNEVFYAKDNNQMPNNGQNLNNNIAFTLAVPKVYIQACNNGFSAACTIAHDSNYNKSCHQIKTNWPDAPTGAYNLTYDGASTPVGTSCSMDSVASAAITGCKTVAAINDSYNCNTASPTSGTNCSNDCFVGYTNNYNRSCAQITSIWSSAPTDTYRLTTNGAPPTATISSVCTAASSQSTCVEGGTGTVCSDGTVYVGNLAGRYIFMTQSDNTTSITWNSGTGTDIETGATDTYNGNTNYTILANSTDAGSPYAAEEACKAMNDSAAYGHTDWYLPALAEIRFVYDNRIALIAAGTTFACDFYWSSTEHSADIAYPLGFDGAGTPGDYYWVDKNWHGWCCARCIRDE